MKKTLGLAGALVSLMMASVPSAWADAIPYPGLKQGGIGTPNPIEYNFKAIADGNVTAYYYGQSGASFTESLGLLVNGVDTGISGLGNHSSVQGNSLDFGSVEAGDILTFYLNVHDTYLNKDFRYYSLQALNRDGVNHVYSTAYSGGAGLPAGTYLGFEDLTKADPYLDFSYNDAQFVLTNVTASTLSTSPVPLPASAPLFGAALLALGAFGYRVKRQASRA